MYELELSESLQHLLIGLALEEVDNLDEVVMPNQDILLWLHKSKPNSGGGRHYSHKGKSFNGACSGVGCIP